MKETFISDGVVQVLDIQIDALEPCHPLYLHLFELLLEFHLPLGLLLGASDVDGLAGDLLAVEVVAGGLGGDGVLEGHEPETLVLLLIGLHQLE